MEEAKKIVKENSAQENIGNEFKNKDQEEFHEGKNLKTKYKGRYFS